MEELSDEDMRLHNRLSISSLHTLENVNEPLEVLLTGSHPDKVQLVGRENNDENYASKHIIEGNQLVKQAVQSNCDSTIT